MYERKKTNKTKQTRDGRRTGSRPKERKKENRHAKRGMGPTCTSRMYRMNSCIALEAATQACATPCATPDATPPQCDSTRRLARRSLRARPRCDPEELGAATLATRAHGQHPSQRARERVPAGPKRERGLSYALLTRHAMSTAGGAAASTSGDTDVDETTGHDFCCSMTSSIIIK